MCQDCDESSKQIQTLLARASQGSREALHALLAMHRVPLVRAISMRIHPSVSKRFDAHDVVQEAFLKALERFDNYVASPRVEFYPWLRALAFECLARLHRDNILSARRSVLREREVQCEGQAVSILDGIPATGRSPSSDIVNAEWKVLLASALNRMSDGDAQVLVLRFLEMRPLKDAAVVLGISISAVRMRQLRALRRLKEVLKELALEASP